MATKARFDLARRLREPTGAPLGEIFSFLSGLYFRGKLAYARAFAEPPTVASGRGGIHVITPGAGLQSPDVLLTLAGLRDFARVAIDADNPRYRRPMLTTARALAAHLGDECEVVLLGSIASDKYVTVLSEVFGDRLRFPIEFVGRGDMSRGGLLLRCVAAGRQLAYVPLDGAVRRGPRPPRLVPLPRVVPLARR